MLHEENTPGFVNGVSILSPGTGAARAYAPVDPPGLAGDGKRPPVLAALDKNARPAAAPARELSSPDFNVWTAGAIAVGRDVVAGVPDKTRTTSQSLTVGVDTRLFEGVKAGFAIGGYTSLAKFDDVGTRDRARAWTVSGYGSWSLGQGVFVDGLLGYGGARFKTSRYDSNADSVLTGSRNGDLFFASVTASWDQNAGQLKYAPYARLDVTHAWLDRYAEQGAADWALAFDKTHVSSQAAVLGLRAQYDMPNGAGVVSPTLRVEYRHGFNGNVAQTMSYVSDPGTTYGLTLSSSRRDALTGSIGLKAKGDGNLSGQIEYSAGLGLQGGGFAGQGLRGTIRLGF
jgi:uncharacterized protein YhjY with autotransporter beta-barrel domain